MDIKSIGAALALVKAKLTGVDTATKAANDAAAAANKAASDAAPYGAQYTAISQAQNYQDVDVRMFYTIAQAQMRYYEKRITALENQVATMAGK